MDWRTGGGRSRSELHGGEGQYGEGARLGSAERGWREEVEGGEGGSAGGRTSARGVRAACAARQKGYVWR